MTEIAFLEVTRPKAYVAMMVPCKIMVDGQKIGEIRNGKTATFEVSAGQHTVQVKQGWLVRSGSLILDCPPNHTIRLQITQNSLFKQLFLKFTGERISTGVDMRLERLA